MLRSTPGMNVRSVDGMTILSADSGGIRKELSFDSTTGEPRRMRRVIVDATIPSGLRAPNGTVLEDVSLDVSTLVSSTDLTG